MFVACGSSTHAQLGANALFSRRAEDKAKGQHEDKATSSLSSEEVEEELSGRLFCGLTTVLRGGQLSVYVVGGSEAHSLHTEVQLGLPEW